MTFDEISASRAAKRVLRRAVTSALGTLEADGSPFNSLVTVASTPRGEPILLLSALARHSRNLARDPRASLLLVASGGEGGDPLAGPRLTLVGQVSGPDDDPMLRRRFLAQHEEAAMYADFGDFRFYRFEMRAAHLVAGFGRVVDLVPEDLLTDCAGCEALLAGEASAVRHMNEDHVETVLLYATVLLGEAVSDWRITGLDPEGADLRTGAKRARLDFPERVTTPEELRQVLVELAKKARAG